MAANDIRVLKHGYSVQRFATEANVTVGQREGDAIRGAIGTGTNYVGIMLNGQPAQETSIWIGVSKSGGTETTAADGVMDVELTGPGTIMECKANTASNVATAAALLGVRFDYVTFDRSADTAAGTLTVDENEGTSSALRGVVILDGRITDGMLYITHGVCTLAVGTGELTNT